MGGTDEKGNFDNDWCNNLFPRISCQVRLNLSIKKGDMTVGIERIHRLGDINVFPNLSMEREHAIDDCKSQGTQWNLDPYSRTNDLNSMEWNPLEGGN